eukprot:ctg_2960.g524
MTAAGVLQRLVRAAVLSVAVQKTPSDAETVTASPTRVVPAGSRPPVVGTNLSMPEESSSRTWQNMRVELVTCHLEVPEGPPGGESPWVGGTVGAYLLLYPAASLWLPAYVFDVGICSPAVDEASATLEVPHSAGAVRLGEAIVHHQSGAERPQRSLRVGGARTGRHRSRLRARPAHHGARLYSTAARCRQSGHPAAPALAIHRGHVLQHRGAAADQRLAAARVAAAAAGLARLLLAQHRAGRAHAARAGVGRHRTGVPIQGVPLPPLLRVLSEFRGAQRVSGALPAGGCRVARLCGPLRGLRYVSRRTAGFVLYQTGATADPLRPAAEADYGGVWRARLLPDVVRGGAAPVRDCGAGQPTAGSGGAEPRAGRPGGRLRFRCTHPTQRASGGARRAFGVCGGGGRREGPAEPPRSAGAVQRRAGVVATDIVDS